MRNAVTFWTAPAAPRPRAIDDCWSPRFVSSFSATFLCFAFSGTETVPIRHAPLPRRARGGALGNVAGMTVAELPVALGSLNVRDTEGTKDGNAVTSANSSFESGDDENERGGAGVPMPMNESSSTRELSTADDRAPATEPKCYDTNAAVSSSASDSSSDETRLRAMHAAAALVHDDRLLEAKRLADQFFLFPPIAACSFYPTDPSPEDEQARSTLDSMLPAAERMVTFLESLKSNPHHGTGGTPNDADDEKDVANKQRAAPNSVPTNPPWQVQGEHMGKRDVSVYYRTDTATGAKLTARIESPIGTDMLVPLLSVLNESELYASWLPNW